MSYTALLRKRWLYQKAEMLESIRNCEKCGLCKNQRPLLDKPDACDVFWVGLSAKAACTPDEPPLSEGTNTGMIVRMAEEQLGGLKGYRTNLVKCLPLDKDGKLRYPNMREIDCCFFNLKNELEKLTPKVVFLLGGKVASSVERHFSLEFKKWDDFEYAFTRRETTYFIPIHHPSYVHVYRRKRMDEYLAGIRNVTESVYSQR